MMGHTYRSPRLVILSFAILMPMTGCETAEPHRSSIPRFESRSPAERVAAIQSATARGDVRSIPHLVDRLHDEDPTVRFAAILALERLTGQRLGYRYGASAADRAEAVARWRRYVISSNPSSVEAADGSAGVVNDADG